MTKKQEKNGVTLHYNEERRSYGGYARKCVDIDVKPGVSEVLFDFQEFDNFDFIGSTKVFPDVTKFKITDSSGDIRLPNSMFPNVKTIKTSRYSRYKENNEGKLIRDEYSSGRKLVNYFDAESDTIDLKGASVIGSHSLEGCKATKIINATSISSCEEDAFKGSAIDDIPLPDSGVLMVGSIIVKTDKSLENIVIPDNRQIATVISEDVDFSNVKSITYHKSKSLINTQAYLPDGVNVILKDKTLIEFDTLRYIGSKLIGSLEICDENPYYKTIDGVLYTKDGSTLIKFPSSKTGHFDIPEGVVTISTEAFKFSSLSSVTMPSTLKTILPMAFSNCYLLENVDFGTGITNIGVGQESNIFWQCRSLKEVEIPSQVKIIGSNAFRNSVIEKVIFHEGLLEIGENAFVGLLEGADVSLPSTVENVGRGNFNCVKSITLTGDKIPFGLISSISYSSTFFDNEINVLSDYVVIKTSSKTLYLPRRIANDEAAWLDSTISVSAFRKIYEDKLYDYGVTPEMKQNTAIAAYRELKTDALKTYLRRASKSIISRFIDTKNDAALIEFIRFGIITRNSLDDTLKIAREKGMTSIEAYLMTAFNKTEEKPSGFSL